MQISTLGPGPCLRMYHGDLQAKLQLWGSVYASAAGCTGLLTAVQKKRKKRGWPLLHAALADNVRSG
jgi:hypothetical protein